MIPSLRIQRRGEWFAGEPFSIGQDSRTDPSGVSCPRKDILAHSDAICNSGVAKVFENDSLSRQIDIVRPPQRLAAPVQPQALLLSQSSPRVVRWACKRVSRGLGTEPWPTPPVIAALGCLRAFCASMTQHWSDNVGRRDQPVLSLPCCGRARQNAPSVPY